MTQYIELPQRKTFGQISLQFHYPPYTLVSTVIEDEIKYPDIFFLSNQQKRILY